MLRHFSYSKEEYTIIVSPVHAMPWTIEGKVCLITGATSGVGFQTALELVRRGAKKVILACRNVEKGEKAAREIVERTAVSSKRVRVIEADLASLDSVRKCARLVNQTEDRLHVLVNNAGICASNRNRTVTVDGFELTFATNHLGHFLLTKLLLPLLKRSAPSRILVVASEAYFLCWPDGLNVDDLHLEAPGKYGAFRAYVQSKLANILFARQLHRRLHGSEEHSSPSRRSVATSGVSVFSLCPGLTNSIAKDRSGMALFHQIMSKMFSDYSQRSADTLVYCACEPGIEDDSGEFFKYSKVHCLYSPGNDDEKGEKLWQESEEMIAA